MAVNMISSTANNVCVMCSSSHVIGRYMNRLIQIKYAGIQINILENIHILHKHMHMIHTIYFLSHEADT